MSETTVRLWSDGLLSKWGFDDGDVLDDITYQWSIDGLPEAQVRDHDLLTAAVFQLLLPRLDQVVGVQEIITIHNPIRAATVDGTDVTGLWLDPNAESMLTPAFVDVSESELRAIAARLLTPVEPIVAS